MNRFNSSALFNFSNHLFIKDNEGIIVTFHRILPASAKGKKYNEFIEIGVENFRNIINQLQELDVEFIDVQELKRRLSVKQTAKKPFVHFTFDDGYEDNYSLAFPVLQQYKIPFSLFLTSGFIENEKPFTWWYLLEVLVKNKCPIILEKYAVHVDEVSYGNEENGKVFLQLCDLLLEYGSNDRSYFEKELYDALPDRLLEQLPVMLNWKQINEMQASGLCTLGIHTVNHPRTGKLSNSERQEQIRSCKEAICKHTSISPDIYSYPFGAAVDLGNISGIPEIFKNAGVEIAFTTIPGLFNNSTSPYFLPRVFFNDSFKSYTLKSRISGAYQRSKKHEQIVYGTP